MYEQGLTYIMPKPKSRLAKSGCLDGRTTWWDGYWSNSKTGEHSEKIPIKYNDGIFYSDGKKNYRSWSTGGCPNAPTKTEWLLPSPNEAMPY